jgi:hypothetical protein
MRFAGPIVSITEAPPILLAGERAAAGLCLAPAQTLNKRREVRSFLTSRCNELKLFACQRQEKKKEVRFWSIFLEINFPPPPIKSSQILPAELSEFFIVQATELKQISTDAIFLVKFYVFFPVLLAVCFM